MVEDAEPLDDIAAVIVACKVARKKAADWKSSGDHLAGQIKAILDERGITEGSVDGKNIVHYKTPKPSKKFQEARFAHDHPELYEQYCEDVPNAARLVIE